VNTDRQAVSDAGRHCWWERGFSSGLDGFGLALRPTFGAYCSLLPVPTRIIYWAATAFFLRLLLLPLLLLAVCVCVHAADRGRLADAFHIIASGGSLPLHLPRHYPATNPYSCPACLRALLQKRGFTNTAEKTSVAATTLLPTYRLTHYALSTILYM